MKDRGVVVESEQFINGNPNGQSTIKYNDGTVFKGVLQDWIPHG